MTLGTHRVSANRSELYMSVDQSEARETEEGDKCLMESFTSQVGKDGGSDIWSECWYRVV